ncbi:hypothetical protein EZV62_003174 [Acer yangbiense]|uniref:Uncharacterized protein n=1 Tax=Acer yangbiense TaxID=1000413 RepID=A0A5C7IGU2_9ROSI|nr:hypothetical protein EZV62_003174 [Acer yangbiense]
MGTVFRCNNKTELSQRSRHGKHVFLVLKKVNFSESVPSFHCQNFLGSQILELSSSFRSYETALSSGAKSSREDSNSLATVRNKNHSWNSLSDLNVFKIYKAVRGADASTQRGDNRTQQRLKVKEVEDSNRNDITDLSGEEVNRQPVGSADIRDQTVGNDRPSRRMKAPAPLIQLIACGSGRFKDCQLIKHKD